MKRSVYFIIQIIWSLVYSTVIWYLALKNASFDFYGNSNDTLTGIILILGAVIYLILTIVQIAVGAKKVSEWRRDLIPVSLVIAAVIGFGGSFAAIYGSEFLNRLIK